MPVSKRRMVLSNKKGGMNKKICREQNYHAFQREHSKSVDQRRRRIFLLSRMAFVCDICAKQFTQMINLVRQKKTLHGGNIFTCERCGEVRVTSARLTQKNQNVTLEDVFLQFYWPATVTNMHTLSTILRIRSSKNILLSTLCYECSSWLWLFVVCLTYARIIWRGSTWKMRIFLNEWHNEALTWNHNKLYISGKLVSQRFRKLMFQSTIGQCNLTPSI